MGPMTRIRHGLASNVLEPRSHRVGRFFRHQGIAGAANYQDGAREVAGLSAGRVTIVPCVHQRRDNSRLHHVAEPAQNCLGLC